MPITLVILLLVIAGVTAREWSLPLPRVLSALVGSHGISKGIRFTTSFLVLASAAWIVIRPDDAIVASSVALGIFGLFMYVGDLLSAGVIIEEFPKRTK